MSSDEEERQRREDEIVAKALCEELEKHRKATRIAEGLRDRQRREKESGGRK